MGRNDAVVRDLALALFESLRGRDVVILTVYKDGQVSQKKETFELAYPDYGKEGRLCLRTNDSHYTDIDPSLCRKLNPPIRLAEGDGVCEDSVMIGYDRSTAAVLVLYRIILCVKR